jgi:hypothetical protein
MKKLALFVTALLVAAFSYAGSTHLSKNSLQSSMSSAWKTKQTTGLQSGHDINIVYGGEDLSPRHELVQKTAFA